MRRGTRRNKSEQTSASESEGSKRAKKEDDSSHYEHVRDQRIKENMERMQNLGLLDLSLKLKAPKTNSLHKKKKTTQDTNHLPERRSSRIMSLAPVNYSDRLPRENHKSSSKEGKEVVIFIPEGTNPEVYTEEQEKLLGDCETTWELYVGGYDVDGNRIYDPIKGETCHQCRQKTLGEHTSCNKCELPQGQFCGDCLYMRYGENVLEVNHNPRWTCPTCRGICNCSRCRRGNGWIPTGNIYSKVLKLGFKSVAHYLIKTRRSELRMEGSGSENNVTEEISETSADATLNRPTQTRRALAFRR